MRSEIIPRRPSGKAPTTLFGGESFLSLTDKIHRAMQPVPVYDDLDCVSIDEPSDGASSQRFGRNVADARSG
jgi:hypothetical protein